MKAILALIEAEVRRQEREGDAVTDDMYIQAQVLEKSSRILNILAQDELKLCTLIYIAAYAARCCSTFNAKLIDKACDSATIKELRDGNL